MINRILPIHRIEHRIKPFVNGIVRTKNQSSDFSRPWQWKQLKQMMISWVRENK